MELLLQNNFGTAERIFTILRHGDLRDVRVCIFFYFIVRDLADPVSWHYFGLIKVSFIWRLSQREFLGEYLFSNRILDVFVNYPLDSTVVDLPDVIIGWSIEINNNRSAKVILA